MPLPREQFLPASAKAELAGRAADLKTGGLPELLRKAGKEMYNNPVVNTAISLTPGAGDLQSGLEALASAREGDWTGAALNGVGVLPFIPALGMTKALRNAAPRAEEFEEARKEGVRLLGLPENNTAMDRAKAMGYTTPAYHGTSKDFSEFDVTGGNGKTNGAGSFFTENPAVASTYANPDGGQVMPTLLRLESPVNVQTNGANWNWIKSNAKVDAPKIKVEDKDGDMLMRELAGIDEQTFITRKPFSKTVKKLFPDEFKYDDHISTDDLARWGKGQGYDSMVFDSVKDRGPYGKFHTEAASLPSKNVAVFNPANIRSRFAAFNPAKADSTNILAGVGAGGLGLAALLRAAKEEEQYQ